MGPIDWQRYAERWAKATGQSVKRAREELADHAPLMKTPGGYPLEWLDIPARLEGGTNPFPRNGYLVKVGSRTHLVLAYDR